MRMRKYYATALTHAAESTARETTMKSVLGCIVLGVFLSVGVSLASEEDAQGAGYECRELRHSICADHFGVESWHGRFPNSRGLEKDDALAEFLHFFALLYQDNYCSHLLYNLLCFHYFPLCSPRCPALAVTPSRKLCAEAVEACLPYARVLYGGTFDSVFPKFLNCTSFAEASSTETCITSSDSATNSSTLAIEPCCSSTEETHSNPPNATIHIDFCPPVGSRVYQAMENGGSVEICVVLANVGSYDPTATLSESITLKLSPKETKTSFLPSANLDDDYSLPVAQLTIPAGSAKGGKLCIEVTIFNDYLKEGRETFSVEATSTSPLPVTFGSGRAQSSSGSVEVIIIDDDEPFIPDDECRGKCSVRNRANSNTFSQNYYTYAVHVEAIRRRDSNHSSLLDIIILECWDLGSPEVCPPENRTRYSIPLCRDCTLDFRSGEEYLIAGRHVRSSMPGNGLYLPSYRKGGLLSTWRKSYGSVGAWVRHTTNQTVH